MCNQWNQVCVLRFVEVLYIRKIERGPATQFSYIKYDLRMKYDFPFDRNVPKMNRKAAAPAPPSATDRLPEQ